jgi:hypothetical protein
MKNKGIARSIGCRSDLSLRGAALRCGNLQPHALWIRLSRRKAALRDDSQEKYSGTYRCWGVRARDRKPTLRSHRHANIGLIPSKGSDRQRHSSEEGRKKGNPISSDQTTPSQSPACFTRASHGADRAIPVGPLMKYRLEPTAPPA